jgi:hypothetical protein
VGGKSGQGVGLGAQPARRLILKWAAANRRPAYIAYLYTSWTILPAI